MPSQRLSNYIYDDPAMVPPVPGKDLIMAVGVVTSRPGVGPKTGGQYIGVPLSVGAATTSFRRHDGVEMRLPNDDLLLWASPFYVAAHRFRVHDLNQRAGWEWLNWTLADHVNADYERSGPDHYIAPIEPEEPHPLVIVPCGARKQEHPAAAGELYISSYHRLALRAASALTEKSNIRILSGARGLLELDTVIEPYNLRLGQPGSITAADIVDQATATGIIDSPHVIALAGKDYARIVTATWPHARTPLAGSRGIGDQQHRLAQIAAMGPGALVEGLTPTFLDH